MRTPHKYLYLLIALNVIACAWLVYDTIPAIQFHKEEGSFSNWMYMTRALVIAWPLLTVFSVLVGANRPPMLIVAKLLNVGVVIFSFYSIGYVLFADAYYLIAVLFIGPYLLLSAFNLYVLMKGIFVPGYEREKVRRRT
jgi:hypothetical protein